MVAFDIVLVSVVVVVSLFVLLVGGSVIVDIHIGILPATSVAEIVLDYRMLDVFVIAKIVVDRIVAVFDTALLRN